MSVNSTLPEALDLLAPWAKETSEPAADRLYVVIEAADLLAAVSALTEARWGYLAAITGVDLGPDAGQIEVLYHFCSGAPVVTLRVRVPRDDARVASLYDIIPSVTFYERELREMLGVEVEGTPNTDRLFLPDDWPSGLYPLRKDFNVADLKD